MYFKQGGEAEVKERQNYFPFTWMKKKKIYL